MNTTNLIILLFLALLTFFVFQRDKDKYEKFKSQQKTEDRQKFYKRWTVEPLIIYGLLSLLILSAIGQFSSLKEMPKFLIDFSRSVNPLRAIGDSGFIANFSKIASIALVPILIFENTISTYLRAYKKHKNKNSKNSSEEKEINLRNLNSLIPRNYKERIWGTALSISAGFSEELFFRVLAPILIYSVTGSALIAIISSIIWFGLGHYYQEVRGIIATSFAGLLLFIVYLITQNIWQIMLIHTVIDFNVLVLSPWLKERFERQLDY